TPHTLSLQATNTLVNTLQGASRGTKDVRYGFEFTVPLTLRRYFGKRAETVAEAPSPDTVVVRADTAKAVTGAQVVPPITSADTTPTPAPVQRADTAAQPTRAASEPVRTDTAARPAPSRPRERPAAAAPAPARRSESAPARVVR